LLRPPKLDGPAIANSLLIDLTLGTPETIFSTSALISALGTSPVSRTMRL
jgi:hypothetical protein